MLYITKIFANKNPQEPLKKVDYQNYRSLMTLLVVLAIKALFKQKKRLSKPPVCYGYGMRRSRPALTTTFLQK